MSSPVLLARGIQWLAVVATVIVAAGFTVFAVGEMAGASERQQAALEPMAPPAQQDDPGSSRVEKVLDGANQTLLDPFAGLVESSNPWVTRGVPTVLALLVYGAGLGFLARYVRSRA